jgi:hypothetical protein
VGCAAFWTLDAPERLKVDHLNECYPQIGAAMKANVTLKIDSEFLRAAKILADEQDCSISAQLAANLEDKAQERAKARLQTGYDLGWTPFASRDEIYER